MGRRGPKPEPAAVKLAKGNSGHRPIGDVSPADDAEKAKVASIKPPAWLKNDGLRVWKRIAPRLRDMKLLAQIDAETFGRYCRNFARWLKMQEVLDKEGETYESESPHGTYKRAHPAYMIADRLERQLVSAEASFGLNPAERQRLFAARAAGATLGGLFDKMDPGPSQAPGQPANADTPVGPIGFLN